MAANKYGSVASDVLEDSVSVELTLSEMAVLIAALIGAFWGIKVTVV